MPNRLKTFQEVLAAAIADIVENGFDSVERVERWTRELRMAAERSMISPASLEQQLRDGLAAVYRRMVDQGGALRYNPGVERFTLEKLKPALRGELDRRILASANLIKLNRAQAIDKTLQRFHGWSTSIPKDGVSRETRSEVKANVRKSLASLPFEERRVLIDQGSKLIASINEIIAVDGGAIAGLWVSHYLQKNYAYREEHKERDHRENNGQPFLIRDSWAHRAGLVKKGKLGYADEVTQPAQEPYCLSGDSRLDLFEDTEKIYRRWYEGPIITITTASGHSVRATPNHPVMTPDGWVSIGALNEGDYAVEIPDKGVESAELHANECVTTFADFFNSMRQIGFSEETRDGMRVNFHGDGTNEEINVITLNRPLRFDMKAGLTQAFDYLDLALTDILLSGIRMIFEGGYAFGFATDSIVRFRERDLTMLFGGAGERAIINFLQAFEYHRLRYAENFSQLVGIFSRFISPHEFGGVHPRFFGEMGSARPQIDEAVNVSIPKGHRTSTDSLGDLTQGLPLSSKPGRIIKVKRDHFAGHVYNLQTGKGWYSGNHIIVSNCRCYYQYLYALRDLPPEMLTAKGKAALAAVQGREEVRSARGARADGVDVAPKIGAEAVRYRLQKMVEGLKRDHARIYGTGA